ncbi:hypothetical protein ACH41H_19115, partial [Streptomyces sp. NPDC020800]|uniref:hypothetical protein n=1 Tax=Streptomyces sp. NPDC020800 TaxID=3365092 RepID=UPI00378B721E
GGRSHIRTLTPTPGQTPGSGGNRYTTSKDATAVENHVNVQLTFAYRLLMEVAREPESSSRQTRLDQVIGLLDPVIEKLEHVRALMRVELGVAQELPTWYDP